VFGVDNIQRAGVPLPLDLLNLKKTKYIKQEDAFDTIDEEELRKKNAEVEEDEYVDILTRADKETEEEDFMLPTHPIPDNYLVPQTVVVPPTKKQTKKRKVGVSSNNRTAAKPKRRKKD